MSMTRKWAIWIPVLMVASLFYWAVALGLGGLSLAMVGSLDTDGDVHPELGDGDAPQGDELEDNLHEDHLKDSYEPITVNLVESSDTRDVGESTADSAAPSQPRAEQGPGQTAF